MLAHHLGAESQLAAFCIVDRRQLRDVVNLALWATAIAEAGSHPMNASTSPLSIITAMSVISPKTRWTLKFIVFSA
jgi:hypothetical protein